MLSRGLVEAVQKKIALETKGSEGISLFQLGQKSLARSHKLYFTCSSVSVGFQFFFPT